MQQGGIKTLFKAVIGLVALIPIAIVAYYFFAGTQAPKSANPPQVKPPSTDVPSR